MSEAEENVTGKTSANIKDAFQFRYVDSTAGVIWILTKRLPKSANVYNMAKVYDNFKKPQEMGFYVMCTEERETQLNEENTWILATYFREDYGMRYVISAPGNSIITPEIKKAFVGCQYIRWNEHYHFTCIDFDISSMIWEISTKVFGNSVTSMPCKIFMMAQSDAAKLDVTTIDDENLEIKSLDPVKGTQFICKTWKYSIPHKTEVAIRKLLTKNCSVGLYASGEVICGMCNNDCGLMGMLYTLPEQRGKGYAKLVAKQLMKSLAVEYGAMPCCAVEMRNLKSIGFHENLGMECSHHADFIKYVPQSWN